MGFDNFGGHTIALHGFKAYNFEGVEMTRMGKSGVLASYPIHYHLTRDSGHEGGKIPHVKSNSIHHCFRLVIL